MSALDELHDTTVGTEFVHLLQRTIRAVAIARNVPAPDGHTRWDETAVAGIAADFLAHPKTPRRLTDLATTCRTDEALKHRLQRTVQHFLADLGRRTPVGRLVLRFNEVLATSDQFKRQGRTWKLAGTAGQQVTADIDALISAASRIDVVAPSAWTTGDRHSPEIDRASVITLAATILEAAGGALSSSVLAQVAARRLGLGGAPLTLDTTAFDAPEPYTASQDTTATAATLDLRAIEVFNLLNDAERISIGLPEVPVAELGPILNMSGSTAALIRKRAIMVIRDALNDDEDGQAIADTVLALTRTWTESRMNPNDPTY